MKKEYDFTKGERGKFYQKDAKFHLPIYLEEDIENFFTTLAKKQNKNLEQIVNALLLQNKNLLEAVK